MKKSMLSIAITTLALTACEQANESADTTGAGADAATELSGDREKVSYGMGYNLGSRIKEEFGLDVDSFALGVRHAVEGGEQLLTDEQIMEELQAFQQRQIQARESEQQEVAAENLEKSEAFLAENADKEGVQTTDSGLQYKVLEQGEGASPGPQDIVEVHYSGRLIDGTVFDSSYERGEPVEFPVHAVIPGWTEALQMMNVGAKYELYLPPDLAYGPAGTGGPIGPNQALLFEVELLDIKESGADMEGETMDVDAP